MKPVFDCVDCGVDTHNEYYMVRHHLWKYAGDINGMLCIGCLEDRLGRTLTFKDFLECPLNDINREEGQFFSSHRCSERLLDRYKK